MKASWRQLQGSVAATFRSPLWRPKGLHYILMLFFFLLPLQTRYIFREVNLYEYGTLSVYGIEILGWVVIGLGLLRYRYREAEPPFDRRLGLLFLLPLFALWSILWAPDKAIALQAAVRLLEGVLLFVVIFTFRHCERGEAISGDRHEPRALGSRDDIVWWAFLAGAVLQAGLGIYQFLSQSSFASTILGMALHDPQMPGTSVVEFGDQRWLRAYGGLPHPNVLGGYLVVALAVAFALLVAYQRSEQSDKIMCGRIRFCQLGLKVMILVLITGIFFSFSRAAWMVGIGLLGYWIIGLLKNRTGKGIAYLLLTTFYILLLGLTFRPLVETRLAFHSSERLETKSRVERVAGLREGWELMKAHPIIGVGIGNYTQGLQQFRPGQPFYSYQPVHNVFLLVWAELGIVGLLLLVAALYGIVRKSKADALVFLCFLVLMMADHYLWTLPLGILLFWPILGLSTNREQDRT